MKVESSNPLRSPARKPTVKAGSAGGARFAQSLDAAGSPGAPSGVSGAGPVSGLDALLSLQTVDDATERAQRGQVRAEEILDRLDHLRADMLTGEVPIRRLMQIADLVARSRAKVDDPRLGAILDDVDLRAQVELAKLGIDSTGQGR